VRGLFTVLVFTVPTAVEDLNRFMGVHRNRCIIGGISFNIRYTRVEYCMLVLRGSKLVFTEIGLYYSIPNVSVERERCGLTPSTNLNPMFDLMLNNHTCIRV
jgi:hypothetical protein